MKFNIFYLLLILNFAVTAQENIKIKHTNYTSYFSTSKYYPVLVEWWETQAKVACENPLPRKDKFKPDPLLPDQTNLKADYLHSGTDRGHMCPAASNKCMGAQVMAECFYFSNMAPQYHALNAGDWEALERLTRDLAETDDSIHVWAGSIGEAKKIGKVAVPTQCWKVIKILKTNQYKAYLFNNDLSHADGIDNNEVNLHELEKLTGFKFIH